MNDTAIWWLRSALRVHDNPVLAKAAEYERLLPVYVFDPRDQDPIEDLRGIEPFGRPVRKIGEHRARFLLETLDDLDAQLRLLGSRIVYRRGRTVEQLCVLAKALGGRVTVYTDEQPGTEEASLYTALRDELDQLSQKHEGLEVSLVTIWEKTVYHPDDLPFAAQDCPNQFKNFWNAVTTTTAVREEVPPPDVLPPLPQNLDPGSQPTLSDLGYTDEEIANSDERAYAGGETAGLQRLHDYGFGTQQLTNYRWTRNRSLGADYSTKWSAYLCLGCLSARHVWREVKRYEEEVKKNASTYWVIRELIWRDFYQVQALKYPRAMFWPGGKRGKSLEWRKDVGAFARWAQGRTGIPFLDAHMRELARTGFMSNRGRVNAASWLSKDQEVMWTWGAAWFESYLIDYDVASNWLNWQSQATELRPTNPIWQGQKYDRKAEYVYSELPELREVPAPLVHGWFGLAATGLAERGIVEPPDYPRPPEVKDRWWWSLNRILYPDKYKTPVRKGRGKA